MSTYVVPVECDTHSVVSEIDPDFGFMFLWCEDCEDAYPPEEWLA